MTIDTVVNMIDSGIDYDRIDGTFVGSQNLEEAPEIIKQLLKK